MKIRQKSSLTGMPAITADIAVTRACPEVVIIVVDGLDSDYLCIYTSLPAIVGQQTNNNQST
jgi:hypothetical protein